MYCIHCVIITKYSTTQLYKVGVYTFSFIKINILIVIGVFEWIELDDQHEYLCVKLKL